MIGFHFPDNDHIHQGEYLASDRPSSVDRASGAMFCYPILPVLGV
jgi:hypothetical protein